MQMPKSLRDTLEVWHGIVGLCIMLAQSVGLVIIGAVWITNSNRDHADFTKGISESKAQMAVIQGQIERIDNEGSRVWARGRPEESKSIDKLDYRLSGIEEKFNNLNLQMAKLIVVSEQNQKLLKQTN